MLLKTIKPIFIILFFTINCQYNSSDKQSSEKQMMGLLLAGAASAGQCNKNAPFAILATAGTTDKCSGCHPGAGGFDISDYNQVKSRVTAGDPDNSLLYRKITTGSMKANATDAIRAAVKCWITEGANP